MSDIPQATPVPPGIDGPPGYPASSTGYDAPGQAVPAGIPSAAPVAPSGGGGGGGPAGVPSGIPVATPVANTVLEAGVAHNLAYSQFGHTFRVGLAWDYHGGKGVDLDASCIALDRTGRFVEACYFAQTECLNGGLVHSGDNRTGQGEGDDESITIFTDRVPGNISAFVFVINSFCGFYDQSGEAAFGFQPALTDPNSNAMVMARIWRDSSDASQWHVQAIGQHSIVKSFADLIPNSQEMCRDIFPGIVIAPPPSTIVLSKGETINLPSFFTSVNIGLGWEFLGTAIDLDASVMAFDLNDKANPLRAACFFGDKFVLGGAVRHGGDNLTGEGAGDDEVVTVDLDRLPSHIQALSVVVTCYSRQPLSSIRNAYVRLFDPKSKKEHCRFSLSSVRGDHTALFMATLYKGTDHGAPTWKISVQGRPTHGSIYKDLLPEVTRFCSSLSYTNENVKFQHVDTRHAAPIGAYPGGSSSGGNGCCTIM